MGNVRLSDAPDTRADPRESGEDHVDNCAEGEDLNGTVALGEAREINAENAVGQGEDAQGNKTRCEQRAGEAQKTEDWDGGEKAQGERAGEIAFECKIFERGNAVGDKNPDCE